MVKVIKIDPRYYFTTYDVKVQVFNQMCEDPYCVGPMTDPVSVYSAEDLPQVFDDVYFQLVNNRKYLFYVFVSCMICIPCIHFMI